MEAIFTRNIKIWQCFHLQFLTKQYNICCMKEHLLFVPAMDFVLYKIVSAASLQKDILAIVNYV